MNKDFNCFSSANFDVWKIIFVYVIDNLKGLIVKELSNNFMQSLGFHGIMQETWVIFRFVTEFRLKWLIFWRIYCSTIIWYVFIILVFTFILIKGIFLKAHVIFFFRSLFLIFKLIFFINHFNIAFRKVAFIHTLFK